MPDLGGGQLSDAEMDALDHRVDRGDRVGARAGHGGIVAEPANDARVFTPKQLAQVGDQLEF